MRKENMPRREKKGKREERGEKKKKGKLIWDSSVIPWQPLQLKSSSTLRPQSLGYNGNQ